MNFSCPRFVRPFNLLFAMIKPQIKIAIAEDVLARLQTIGDRYGMSANAVAAAAAYEMSRVRPENLWHALGRIAAGEGVDELRIEPGHVESLPPAPAPRKRPARAAIPVNASAD